MPSASADRLTSPAAQGKKLMEMLSQVVRGLDRLEEIRPAVAELGRRHAGYGVELRHFDAVEQALLESFRQVLGKRWSVDLRLAWSGIYNQLAGIMIEAGDHTLPSSASDSSSCQRS